MIKTGIDHTTIMAMSHGRVPKKGLVIDFATGIGEPVNKWLQLAGYPPLPTEPTATATDEPPPFPIPAPSPVPRIPSEITTAIVLAPTREERVRIAFDWLWLHAGELGVRFGSGNGDTVDARIAIIRAVESQIGIRLLPPDVV